MEQMLGSYGPHPKGEAYTKNFDPEESPSGMLARSGTYHVRSRVVDDDGQVYAGKPVNASCIYYRSISPILFLTDWDWSFKLGKDWA